MTATDDIDLPPLPTVNYYGNKGPGGYSQVTLEAYARQAVIYDRAVRAARSASTIREFAAAARLCETHPARINPVSDPDGTGQ